MRYGSIRDIVLCATVALADGRVLRAGRPVVKNVAGYDLVKLFTGSFGTLGLLTDVTLKLTALPRARRTLAAPMNDLSHGLKLAGTVLPKALVASALVLAQQIDVPGMMDAPFTLLFTAEGMPEDVDAEIIAVGNALRRAGAEVLLETALDGNAAWRSHLASPHLDERVSVRAGVPLKSLPALLDALPAATLRPSSLLADCASGTAYFVRNARSASEIQNWLAVLRDLAHAFDGYAAVIGGPPLLLASVDRWGYRPGAMDLMQKLKARWDPAHILNPGTFLVD
jgi:D-lactate dehydrogenase (cytochrome)